MYHIYYTVHNVCIYYVLVCMHSYADVTESTFDVSYEAEDASGVPIIRMRLRSGVFNLRDGLFLYQFRVFDDYKSVKISVRYRGKHVAGSPYTVGPVFHENCACPLRSAEEWMSDFKCPESESQIRADLEQFREAGGINITNLYERGGEMFPRNSFIHYSIVDGKVCASMLLHTYVHGNTLPSTATYMSQLYPANSISVCSI